LRMNFHRDDLHVPASHVMLTSRALRLIALIRPSPQFLAPVLRARPSRSSFRASMYAHYLFYLGRYRLPSS
jgi:hypothetical protein